MPTSARLHRTKAFPLRGRWHGEAVTDEVLAPKDSNAPKLLQTPSPRRRAARPLAAVRMDRLHTAPMVPNGCMWACARFCYVRGLCCLRRAHFLSRQEMGERNGRGEDSDFFPPDPLFETAQGAPPLADPPGPERNQIDFGRCAIVILCFAPEGAERKASRTYAHIGPLTQHQSGRKCRSTAVGRPDPWPPCALNCCNQFRWFPTGACETAILRRNHYMPVGAHAHMRPLLLCPGPLLPPAGPFLVPSRNGRKNRPGGRFRFLPPGPPI